MVDLEALEKSLTFRALDEGECEGLIAEVRALRAERDALNESADALSDRWDGLVAERDAYDGDLTRSIARIAELTRLGMSVVDALGHISHNNQWGLYQAVDAWRRAVRG